MFLAESTGALRYVLLLSSFSSDSSSEKNGRYLDFTGGLALQDQIVCWWEVGASLLSILATSRGCPCRGSKSSLILPFCHQLIDRV